MTEPRISYYSGYPEISPEMEASVVANIYRFVLDSKDNATGVSNTGGNDAKKGSLKHEVRARARIP
jgi:hypothetical protein